MRVIFLGIYYDHAEFQVDNSTKMSAVLPKDTMDQLKTLKPGAICELAGVEFNLENYNPNIVSIDTDDCAFMLSSL